MVGRPCLKVGSPSWRVESGWEAHLQGWEWSGGPPVGPGVVRRHARRAGIGQEALPEGWECSRGSHKGQGEVGRPTRMVGRPSQIAGSDREAHPDGPEL